MSVSRELVALTALCVMVGVMHVQVVTATSDPVSAACSPLCSEYSAVSTKCAELRNCYQYVDTDRATFVRCVDPCWELGAPCYSLCRENFGSLYDTCKQQCQGNDNYFDCVHSCFADTFIQQRDSQMSIPSPDIGPFEADA